MIRLVIFDTETTGLVKSALVKPDEFPEIIEFAAIHLIAAEDVNGWLIEEANSFTTFVRPNGPITDEVTKITGITKQDVANAPSFSDIAATVRDWIEDADIQVAHNLAFDAEIIDYELKRAGMPKLELKYPVCTVEQTLHLSGHRLSLGALHSHLFGSAPEKAHRALDDVKTLSRCVQDLMNKGELI
jgi:DNA polymerase III epsilon subunit family exonuclease